MRRRGSFAGAWILALALHGSALGQPTGRIEGRVFDATTGEPLIGGQVVIEETALGNVTRGDGTFFIERVPVGVQHVRTEYLGYEEESREARILPGTTTKVDFALGGAVIDTPAIVATIEHEPWIPDVALPPKPLVVPVVDDLPERPRISRCDVRAVLHGAYIQDGRWQMQTTVDDLRCWSDEEPEPSPCERRAPARSR